MTKMQHTSSDTPKHVAVIMDGNGRWARARGLPRTMGHKKGAESARKIVSYALNAGVEYITLFGFSSENWNRPKSEINELMKLLRHYLRSETAELHSKNAKLTVIGDRTAFDNDIIELINNAEHVTKDNDQIHVIIALNYGGRQDIAQAALKIAQIAAETGQTPNANDIQDQINASLLTANIPDPDLLIRTSGEQRISNFLLWQCAYTEMIFTDCFWPDFNEKHFNQALHDYAARDRRFGTVKQSER